MSARRGGPPSKSSALLLLALVAVLVAAGELHRFLGAPGVDVGPLRVGAGLLGGSCCRAGVAAIGGRSVPQMPTFLRRRLDSQPSLTDRAILLPARDDVAVGTSPRRRRRKPLSRVQRFAVGLLGLAVAVFFGVLLLAVPPDADASRAVDLLKQSSRLVQVSVIELNATSAGRGGTAATSGSVEIPGVTERTVRLSGVFEASGGAPGRYRPPPGSRYAPPLLVRYRTDPSVAMAEIDYQAFLQSPPLRIDLYLLALSAIVCSALMALRFVGPLRGAPSSHRRAWVAGSLGILAVAAVPGVSGLVVDTTKPLYVGVVVLGATATLALAALGLSRLRLRARGQTRNHSSTGNQ